MKTISILVALALIVAATYFFIKVMRGFSKDFKEMKNQNIIDKK